METNAKPACGQRALGPAGFWGYQPHADGPFWATGGPNLRPVVARVGLSWAVLPAPKAGLGPFCAVRQPLTGASRGFGAQTLPPLVGEPASYL